MVDYLLFNGFSSNNNLYKNIKIYANNHKINLKIIDWNQCINKLKRVKDLYTIDKSKRYILIGHSWGCQIALKYYNYYYKNIDKIILIDYHPLYRYVDNRIDKKILVDGFFPDCSKFKKTWH